MSRLWRLLCLPPIYFFPCQTQFIYFFRGTTTSYITISQIDICPELSLLQTKVPLFSHPFFGQVTFFIFFPSFLCLFCHGHLRRERPIRRKKVGEEKSPLFPSKIRSSVKEVGLFSGLLWACWAHIEYTKKFYIVYLQILTLVGNSLPSSFAFLHNYWG